MPPEQEDRPDPETLDLLSKQVDRYQAVISRLAGNSLQAKTWSVTLAAALAAVAVNNDQPGILFVAAVALLAFGGLDAYYLSLERHFRDASKGSVARGGSSGDWRSLFVVEAPSEERQGARMREALASSATYAFYGPLALLLLVGGILISALS